MRSILALLLISTTASAECKIVGKSVQCPLAEYQALLTAQQQLVQVTGEVNRCAQHTQTLAAQVNQCSAILAQAQQQKGSSGGGLPAILAGGGMIAAVPFIPVLGIAALLGGAAVGYGVGKEAEKESK